MFENTAPVFTLKEPISLTELRNNKPVIFDVDPDRDYLDDDEYEEEIEDGNEMVDEDPRRYARRANRPFIENYVANIGAAFSSFYDPEEMGKMESVVVEGMVCAEGAVKKMVIKEGAGPFVDSNCKVFIHYVCMAEGEDEPFDNSLIRGYPHCMDMRGTEMVPGLLMAIQRMSCKEVAKIWIRYDYGYGEAGCPPRIPQSANLQCIVEILDIVEENQLKTIPFMTTQERAALEFTDIHAAAKELRMNANGDYKAGALWQAVKRYRKAVAILEDYGTSTEDEQKQRQELLYTIYTNLALCYLKLERYKQACVACQIAIRTADSISLQMDGKVYFRFAQAKLQLGNPKHARNLNAEALRREPKDPKVIQQKAIIENALREEEIAEKATYSKLGRAFFKNEENSAHK